MNKEIYILILSICFSIIMAKADVRIIDLKVEQEIDPLGIDLENPAVSWNIEADENGIYQEAYAIEVFTQTKGIKNSIWQSGRVESDQQHFITLPIELQPHTRYFWRVKLWIKNKGETNWSAESSFVSSLAPEDWVTGDWIAYDTLTPDDRLFPGVHALKDDKSMGKVKDRAIVPLFRKSFNIHKKEVTSAILYVAGLGQYEAYINGKKVGDSFLSPGWSNYQKTVLFNTYDVYDYLIPESNVIGAIVGPGFRYINNERYKKIVIGDQLPIFKAVMIIDYADGTSEQIVTDNSWETLPSAITFSSIYGGEDYDANEFINYWCEPNMDNKVSWDQVAVLNSYNPKMKSERGYPLREMETFQAISKKQLAPNKYLYDFGQNLSGIINIQFRGPAKRQIKITPAEVLDDDGLPYQEASGGPFYFEYTSSGSLKGESWKPLFTYYGFRYALVEFSEEDFDEFDIHAIHTRNSSPRIGEVETSNKLFNDIYHLINWGIKSNLASVATDCPHREKLGWLEQTHLIGNSIQYNYDIYHLYQKIIDDMIDGQQENGLVPDIVPEYVEFEGGFRDSPEWGSASIIMPWYHYQWFGDIRILQKAFPMMERYFAYLTSQADQNILDHGLGDWFDIGPKPPGVSQLTPISLTATATYFYDARILIEVAEALGQEDKADMYRNIASKIKQAFNQKFFDPSTASYATNSQTSLAMPLYMGLVEMEHEKQILHQLINTVEKDGKSLTAGDIGYRYFLKALADHGQSDVIYEMNNRDDVPGYGYQIRNGATALTESWQAFRFVSNNHMMLGHLMEWLFESLAGIQQAPESVGFKEFVIKPYISNEFDWVKAKYKSIYGDVEVKWELQDKNLLLNIDIPPGTHGKIVLPLVDKDCIQEISEDKNKRSFLTLSEKKSDYTIITVQSGSYQFSAPNFSID